MTDASMQTLQQAHDLLLQASASKDAEIAQLREELGEKLLKSSPVSYDSAAEHFRAMARALKTELGAQAIEIAQLRAEKEKLEDWKTSALTALAKTDQFHEYLHDFSHYLGWNVCDAIMDLLATRTRERDEARAERDALDKDYGVLLQQSNTWEEQVHALHAALVELVAQWREGALALKDDGDLGTVVRRVQLRVCADELEAALVVPHVPRDRRKDLEVL